MKLQGYSTPDENLTIENVHFLELAEINLMATPDELRKIADFLKYAAAQMEKMGETFDHVHLADQQSGFECSPHLVVFKPEVV